MHKQVFRVNGNLCRVKRKGKGFYEIKALIKGNLYVFKVDIINKDDELKLYDVDLDKISIWTIEALAQNGFGMYVDEGKPFSTDDYRKPLTTVVDSPVFIKLDNSPINLEGIQSMENTNKETKETVNETEEKVVDITTLNVVEEKQSEESTESVKEVESVVETKSETVEEQVADPINGIDVEPNPTPETTEDREEQSSLSTFSVWGNRVMKAAVVGATGYLLYRTVKYIMED